MKDPNLVKALGNRSILANPSYGGIVQKLIQQLNIGFLDAILSDNFE